MRAHWRQHIGIGCSLKWRIILMISISGNEVEGLGCTASFGVYMVLVELELISQSKDPYCINSP